MSKIKNPLKKRLPRELKKDLGKYAVIFLFMVLLISLVSAFLVADNSVKSAYDEGFSKYNLEWGHFTLSMEAPEDFIANLEEENNIEICDLRYFEEKSFDGKKNIRVYKDRTNMNTECLMSGEMPVKDNEIALDRMFAQNNDLEIGDTITLNGKELTVSGLIAVPDYSCLFEKNTDMMFDSLNFSIAVMTEAGYDMVNSSNQFYNYAFQYKGLAVDLDDDAKEKKLSDAFLENLIYHVYENDLMSIDNYVPRYTNQAINFTGDDMGSDKAMFLLFDYIVIAILAFVFAVTISNTITEEAGVIGTLRASGFSRMELIRHYMILPVVVTLLAAVIGNIFGYTFMKQYMIEMYYNSYSLCTYETLWNMEAFVDTTVIPIILMILINFFTLAKKMKLSPLKFLRRDLSTKQKKKAFRLNTKIPFIHRFRLRILFQNISNYITLFIGVIFASMIIIFGFMFGPLLDNYAEKIEKSMIANYQYVVINEAKTENAQAERYCLTSLETTNKKYRIDEITIYGIENNSTYIPISLEEGSVVVSTNILLKYSLEIGDTITLKDPYGDDDALYDFKITGSYDYDTGMAIFLPRDAYLKTFNKSRSYFTGYFSNEKLEDLEDCDIATVVGIDDYTKTSRQLKVSMGSFMGLFKYFGMAMFLLLMFLLSKQIIEKNAQSISMTKILGFYNSEIGGLYVVATSIVVVISLLLAAPITKGLLKLAFTKYLYTVVSGYIPFEIANECFIKTILLGILCYGIIAALLLVKISKIPKSDALKNVE